MRAVPALCPAFSSGLTAQIDRWLQAGSSSAYRLALLRLPRPVATCAVALLLYLA
jgi:hypothetical protein